MSALTSKVRNARARPLTFDCDLPDGTRTRRTIHPPTNDQVMRCLELELGDEDAGASAAEKVVRLARQARILLVPDHVDLMDLLQPRQVAEIVAALYVAASGLDPAAYAEWQHAQRQAKRVYDATELLAQIEAMIIDVAARLQTLPAEVGAMPLADTVALQERLAQLEKQRVENQAVIAGKEIEWRHA